MLLIVNNHSPFFFNLNCLLKTIQIGAEQGEKDIRIIYYDNLSLMCFVASDALTRIYSLSRVLEVWFLFIFHIELRQLNAKVFRVFFYILINYYL